MKKLHYIAPQTAAETLTGDEFLMLLGTGTALEVGLPQRRGDDIP